MTNPPTVARLSQTLASIKDIDADERAIAEQLQAALSPSFVLIRRIGAGGVAVARAM